MWLDIEWLGGEEWLGWIPRGNREWPLWVLVEPHEITPNNRPEPYLLAVYDDGTEVGPYPVVLPQPLGVVTVSIDERKGVVTGG